MNHNREIEKLVRAYKDAVKAIYAELDRIDISNLSRAKSAAALVEVTKILASLNEESAAWVAENVPKAAREGVLSALVSLDVEDAEKIAKFSRINREMVAAAVADTQADLLAVTKNVERRVRSAVRQVTAESMRANLAKGVNGRRTISRDILDGLRKKLGDSVNSGIIDAAGRRWKPDVYVEMVTRTKLAETHREATMNEAIGRGALYGRISRHGAKDACRFYEGTIVKFTPDAPGNYRYIGDLPRREIFHPRCRHVITPVRDPGIIGDFAYSPGSDKGDVTKDESRNEVSVPAPRELPAGTESIIKSAEGSIRNLQHEVGMVFDYRGNKLWENVGEARRVNIAEARDLGILAGNVFTHNHPDSLSFSRADIALLIHDSIGVIRATSPHYLYSMSRGTANVSIQEMAEDYEIFRELLRPQYSSKIRKGIIEEQEALIELYHDTVSRLSEKYGFAYQREELP